MPSVLLQLLLGAVARIHFYSPLGLGSLLLPVLLLEVPDEHVEALKLHAYIVKAVHLELSYGHIVCCTDCCCSSCVLTFINFLLLIKKRLFTGKCTFWWTSINSLQPYYLC
jgi:hypothetical protein